MLFGFSYTRSVHRQHDVTVESAGSGAGQPAFEPGSVYELPACVRLTCISVCEVGCHDEMHECAPSLKRGRHVKSWLLLCVYYLFFYAVDSRQPNLCVWLGEPYPDP